jgi:hypothetical protein
MRSSLERASDDAVGPCSLAELPSGFDYLIFVERGLNPPQIITEETGRKSMDWNPLLSDPIVDGARRET